MSENFKKQNLYLIIEIVAMIVYGGLLIFTTTNAISYANGQLEHLKNQRLVGSDLDKIEHLINNAQIAKWFIIATIILLAIALIVTVINRAKANKSFQLIILGLIAVVGILYIVGLAFGTPLLALVNLVLLIPAYRGYQELNRPQSTVQQVTMQ